MSSPKTPAWEARAFGDSPGLGSVSILYISFFAKIALKKCLVTFQLFTMMFCQVQCAKKVVSDSPGLVDFVIGIVNSVVNLPDGQVMFFEEFE